MIALAVNIDASSLNAAVAYGLQFSKRTPAQNINSAALAVVNRTIELTPYVTQQTIDTELGVAVTLQKKKRGSGFKRAKRTEVLTGGKKGDIVTTVPLVVLIMQARKNPDSNYNRRTNQRWRLPQTAFTGAGGRAAMAAAINRMIKTRHSSIKFLIAGWVGARNMLRGKGYSGEPVIDVDATVISAGDKGRADPAQEGSAVATCVIENLIGMANSPNAANYNQALLRHGTGPLQQAINEVAEDKMRHIWEKQLERELAPIWNK